MALVDELDREVIHRGIPDTVFTGEESLTQQELIHAKTKLGVVFENSVFISALAASGVHVITFETSAIPVVLEKRIVGHNAASALVEVFKDTVATGGTAVQSYNLDYRSSQVSTVAITSGVTVSDIGTKIGSDNRMVGSAGVGQRGVGSFSDANNIKVLAPNTKYCLRITNTSANPAEFSLYWSFYEGEV